MSTILSFLSGRQLTNNSGVPQVGAKLYHYRAGTTTPLTVWQDAAATTPHPQPVECDAGGFLPAIYVDDSYAWKTLVTTSADVTLSQYSFDNIPKAVTAASSAAFAPPLFEWTQITSASSPVSLTVNDVGNAYEADATGGNIQFNLPSAASVGNGKGFVFKKMSAANSMFFDPNGSETIDGSSAQLFVGNRNEVIGIFSNGAQWYKIFGIELPIPTVQRFTSGTAQTYTPATNVRYIRVSMRGGGGGGGASVTNSGSNGTTSSFGSWTAILGQGGAPNNGTPGAGGTGGANGTGTLINRVTGQAGTVGSTDTNSNSFDYGGQGGGAGGGTAVLLGTGIDGKAAVTNSGGGGGGARDGSGGGEGEYVEFFATAPTATAYTVGAGGAGGTAGTNAGGNGAAGIIIVEEYY